MREERIILKDQPKAAPVSRNGGQIRAFPTDLPLFGRSSPAMMRSNVDLPLPDAPSRQTVSPAATVNEIPRKSSSPS